MTDNVERHKSTRWVKGVPTYGDWTDDDYEDNSGGDVDQSSAIHGYAPIQQQNLHSMASQIPLEEGVGNVGVANDGTSISQKTLVLSIDKKNRNRDLCSDSSDNDEEEEEQKEVNSCNQSKPFELPSSSLRSEQNENFANSNKLNSVSLENVPQRYKEAVPEESFPVEPKEEENSYYSSVSAQQYGGQKTVEYIAESITKQQQKPSQDTTNVYEEEDFSQNQTQQHRNFQVPPTPTYSEFSNRSGYTETISEASFQSESSIQKEPTDLSLRKMNVNDKPSEVSSHMEHSDNNESLPHDPQKLVLSIDKKLGDTSDSTDDDNWGYNGTDSSDEDAADESSKTQPKTINTYIDSLINELSGESFNEENNAIPSPSNIRTSFDTQTTGELCYDGVNGEIESPLAPLSVSAAQYRPHALPLNESSKRKVSVRKPPKSRDDDLGYYSNIVSDYGDQGESIEDDRKTAQSSNKKDEIAPPNNDIQSIVSSGSLSTGKLSMDYKGSQKPGDGEKDENKGSRRISQGTFNFDNWVPNTESFRNQFISGNDNESTVNYQPSDSEKVANVGIPSGLSVVVSNTSTTSLPETIDVAMPSIQEDFNASDDDDNDEFHDSQSSDRLKSTITQDSILDCKSYSTPLFKEEKLTPAPSKDDFSQKYTSLIPPNKSVEDPSAAATAASSSSLAAPVQSEHRSFSNSSGSMTLVNVVDKSAAANTFIPGKYPVFDWKAIIAISQPIDRIAAFEAALSKEANYDTGLQTWLNHTLKQSSDFNNIHIGKIASQAYQNALHSDLRRHGSFRSKVFVVKDKVEGTGSTASNFGKKLFSRSKKFISGDK
ncbi:hypothetical protein KGF56_003792 [Candida oxycetoniae]|uniref:Protein FYV8 n=1 Tax=Candida oxycetoniae TaxID=497107 RepID=A0AAI9WWL6_9ASCO|nr:uncharacterized protein KGF56_003792 [Candida oxycetoniae]KAI3403371.2 hypothetical protein KGF56_003792 [Candida oxycetoniae]